ncbi:MAG: acetoacetate decarboxylase family protein [Iamia sp.]
MSMVTLLDGSETAVDLPVKVRRADAVVVTWLLPLDVVAGVLAHHTVAAPLEPVPMARGRALVTMPFVRYLDGDLGAYNEMGLGFVVRRRDDPDREVASFIAHLPVDGEFTCAAGRQLWGFPKWVASELSIERSRGGARTHFEDADGSEVAAMSKPGLIPLPSREMRLTTYAGADGTLLATPFTMHSAGLRVRPGGTSVRAEGDAPLAADVRALGLDTRRPLSTLWVAQLTGTFGAAHPA